MVTSSSSNFPLKNYKKKKKKKREEYIKFCLFEILQFFYLKIRKNLIKSLFYPPQTVKTIKMKYRMMTSSSSNFPLKN